MAADSGGGTPPRMPPRSRHASISLSDLHGFHTVEATETFREIERRRVARSLLAEPGEDARANHELAESTDPLAETRRAPVPPIFVADFRQSRWTHIQNDHRDRPLSLGRQLLRQAIP